MNEDTVRQSVAGLSALAPLNSGLRLKIANILLEVGKAQRVAAGTTLFTLGEPSNDLGVLLIDGELDIEKEGNPSVTAYAPDIIGEMAQLNPTRQRTATVRALTELKVLRFSWKRFASVAQTKLTDEELTAFTSAVQEHAWKHFTQ